MELTYRKVLCQDLRKKRHYQCAKGIGLVVFQGSLHIENFCAKRAKGIPLRENLSFGKFITKISLQDHRVAEFGVIYQIHA